MGAKRFACPAPDGTRCDSLRQVYEDTDRDDYLDQRRAQRRGAASAQADAPDALHELLSPDRDLPHASLPEALPTRHSTVPLRTQAKILRVWVAPYEDGRGDLHAHGHVYLEIEPRRWAIGGIGNDARIVARPLQVGSPEPEAGTQTVVRPGTRIESPARNQAVSRRR